MNEQLDRRLLLGGLAGAAGVAALASLAKAGPLTPPPGPVTPTGKTLAELEPRIAISAANTPGDGASLFRITQPGSYYLTGNITGVPDRHGIFIASGRVTLDLNGFALLGVPDAIAGIVSAPAAGSPGVKLRNGTVANWGGSGIDLSAISGAVIETIIAVGNGGNGIRSGGRAVIRGCAALNNGDYGIVAFDGGVVEACTSTGNAGGIAAGNKSVITACSAANNTSHGLSINSEAVAVDCQSGGNTGDGIIATSRCVIERCSVTDNDASGIRVTGGCRVVGNVCASNGDAPGTGNIRVTGSDNRIEGNTCSIGPIGITVTGSGNAILRNVCSGHTTNWSIAAGNAVAPIVAASTNASAVSGNTYSGNMGSSDPNANFTI